VDHPPLDFFERVASIALIPVSVEGLRHYPELNEEIAGEVLGLSFAALLSPEAEQSIFVIAHDDAGIGATDKGAAFSL
jgi:hypothetical protein